MKWKGYCLSMKVVEWYHGSIKYNKLIKVYLLLNHFRALNCMSRGVNIYPSFENLSTVDPYFILPILVFISNFIFLKITRHPWLINYSDRKLLYLSFLLSTFSIFWPKCYCISWISYTLTHACIYKISNYIYSRKYISYEEYVAKTYKFKNIYKNN